MLTRRSFSSGALLSMRSLASASADSRCFGSVSPGPLGRSSNLSLRDRKLPPASTQTEFPSSNQSLSLFDKSFGVCEPQRLFVKGQRVTVQIDRLSAEGAVGAVDGGTAMGFISSSELRLFKTATRHEIKNGLLLTGYVARFVPSTSEKYKDLPCLTILLRPLMKQRCEAAAEAIEEALKLSENGSLPVGDKSSVNEINHFFQGMSKSDFKQGVSRLLRIGTIVSAEKSIYLKSKHPQIENITESTAYTNASKAFVRKDKPLFLTGRGRTVYVGPIPKELTTSDVYDLLHQISGMNCVEAVKLATDRNKESKGFGFALIYEDIDLKQFLAKCRNAKYQGAKLRITEYMYKEEGSPKEL